VPPTLTGPLYICSSPVMTFEFKLMV
jgi:hypothetical protein